MERHNAAVYRKVADEGSEVCLQSADVRPRLGGEALEVDIVRRGSLHSLIDLEYA